ncbi:hypothetical protein [Rhizobium sp. NZLR1]|uniref:hypothetical protein n=1 Tax=Rhizobium sp. NZLR1 TaxID=2731096 RepID=UPI001A98DB94|nr:hypothetical protein [Rhizobium sp. NZLR1]MBX5205865.1 hypothetical protein [Rhizobium sp. NZLR1]QSZ20669.1 hypothetical protein J3O30_20580 [Rhizobium sp. NZLR1]
MSDILKGSWIGDLRGTQVANLFAEFEGSELVLRAGNSQGTFAFKGNIENAAVGHDLVLASVDALDRTTVTLRFSDIEQQVLAGRWETSSGHAGPFRLGPVPASVPTPTPENTTSAPIRFRTRTEFLPRMKIYREEIRDLTAVMKNMLSTPFEVVVRANRNGGMDNVYEPDFWKLPGLPRETSEISLSLTEPANPLSRSIDITVGGAGTTCSVSGTNDVWVGGVLEELKSLPYLRRRRFRSIFEQFGLSFNGLLLLFAIAYSADLPLFRRLLLFAITVGLAWAFKLLYDRTTASVVFLDDRKPTSWLDGPRLFTTLVGAAIVAAVPWLYSLFSGSFLMGLLGP